MSQNYNPYENSAIVSVRKYGNTQIVHKDSFDSENDPVFNPKLVLVNREPIPESSIQQRYTTDSYNYCKKASMFGGSTYSIDYNSSYDAYQAMRGNKSNTEEAA